MAEAIVDFSLGGPDPLKNQKIELFNFAGVVEAFDVARSSNTGLTSWALKNALANFQLGGSDSAAIGGDIAYYYGRTGSLSGIGTDSVFATLADTNFGAGSQGIHSLTSLQTGSVRLA